jgi:hypothetical protein
MTETRESTQLQAQALVQSLKPTLEGFDKLITEMRETQDSFYAQLMAEDKTFQALVVPHLTNVTITV